ncbi:MAG: hypothetical protein KAS18_05290 [Calditrichia bacterium]|nr:hypothetical protein [Calditrichia bacterium]
MSNLKFSPWADCLSKVIVYPQPLFLFEYPIRKSANPALPFEYSFTASQTISEYSIINSFVERSRFITSIIISLLYPYALVRTQTISQITIS